MEKNLPKGERYSREFHCHGCQTCIELQDDNNAIQHPHILSKVDVTDEIENLKSQLVAKTKAIDDLQTDIFNISQDNLKCIIIIRACKQAIGEDRDSNVNIVERIIEIRDEGQRRFSQYNEEYNKRMVLIEAFTVNMICAFPEKSHEEIKAEIDRILDTPK